MTPLPYSCISPPVGASNDTENIQYYLPVVNGYFGLQAKRLIHNKAKAPSVKLIPISTMIEHPVPLAAPPLST